MTHDVEAEISELTALHRGLSAGLNAAGESVLSGPLAFAASAEGFDTITDSFDIEITIRGDYSARLPSVRETAGRIERTYEHIYANGSFCLAVPIEERRIFLTQPTLLGFVNNVVIPYLYSYCHWTGYGEYPFGDRLHGSEGVLQHYLEITGFKDEVRVLAALSFLFEHGYRGHHACPCGSGTRVRRCHGALLRSLQDQHTPVTLQHDLVAVLDAIMTREKEGNLSLPEHLRRRIVRILNNRKLD